MACPRCRDIDVVGFCCVTCGWPTAFKEPPADEAERRSRREAVVRGDWPPDWPSVLRKVLHVSGACTWPGTQNGKVGVAEYGVRLDCGHEYWSAEKSTVRTCDEARCVFCEFQAACDRGRRERREEG